MNKLSGLSLSAYITVSSTLLQNETCTVDKGRQRELNSRLQAKKCLRSKEKEKIKFEGKCKKDMCIFTHKASLARIMKTVCL